MTLLRVIQVVTLLLWVIALWLGSIALFCISAVALIVVIGLGVVFPRYRLFGNYVCHGKSSSRRVALTFDDGPDMGSTPALLDLLRDAGVKAAFFGVGKRVAAHPELAVQIVREGHLLENHSYAHSNLTNIFSVAQLHADLSQTQMVIQQTTGIAPQCFRPPMGLSNPRIFSVARTLGLKVIGWSTRGLDTKLTEPEKIVARIERKLEPGAIILLHDGNIPAERLVKTVKLLLEKLRAHEYEIVRLDQILP